MFINLGRLLMVFVWGVLLYNAFNPVSPPIHYFLYFILAFMTITNGLKVLMMSALSQKTTPLMTGQKIRLFLFGVFELKAIFNQQKETFSATKDSKSQTLASQNKTDTSSDMSTKEH